MTTLLNSHRRPCRIISFITQGVVRLQWRQVTSAGGGPGLALSWPDRRPLESSSPARGERSVTWITEEGLIVHKSTSERKPYNCLGPTKLLYSLPHRIVGILTTTVLMRLNTAWKLLAARLVKKKNHWRQDTNHARRFFTWVICTSGTNVFFELLRLAILPILTCTYSPHNTLQ